MTLLLPLLSALQSQPGQEGGFWFPVQASNHAPFYDWVFFFILIVSAVFLLAITVSAVWFLFKYHRSRAPEPEPSTSHSTTIEIVWSVIPAFLLAYMFWLGFVGFMDHRTPPADAYEIYATGRKWSWSFTYPNGAESEELHVPLDRPVKIIMGSQDVIHSLFIPAFRVKQDVVPGRYTDLWFTATMEGEFELYCAEYCGKDHSSMQSTVFVQPEGQFNAWAEEAADFISKLPPAEAGARVFKMKGCIACHSTDGSVITGPSFKGQFGTERKLADGSTVVMDENYIRKSILEPNSQVVAGFDPVMTNFQGQVTDDQIRVLIEYIKSVKE